MPGIREIHSGEGDIRLLDIDGSGILEAAHRHRQGVAVDRQRSAGIAERPAAIQRACTVETDVRSSRRVEGKGLARRDG